MTKKNTRKGRQGVVYSTDPEFNYSIGGDSDPETPPEQMQKLIVRIEKKSRGGKTATLIEGFIGKKDDIESLGKSLKTRCGVGGSVKDGVILIQGEFKEKVYDILKSQGYTVKKSGG
ncbi:MAG: translation initiation factor [Cyclobacteriaceae bacterium]|nr:translation initiation factor [Cyclobacteriaceae bacterium]